MKIMLCVEVDDVGGPSLLEHLKIATTEAEGITIRTGGASSTVEVLLVERVDVHFLSPEVPC